MLYKIHKDNCFIREKLKKMRNKIIVAKDNNRKI